MELDDVDEDDFVPGKEAKGDAKYIQEVRDKRNKERERRFSADSIHTSSPALLPSYLARVKVTSNLPANLCYSDPHHK